MVSIIIYHQAVIQPLHHHIVIVTQHTPQHLILHQHIPTSKITSTHILIAKGVIIVSDMKMIRRCKLHFWPVWAIMMKIRQFYMHKYRGSTRYKNHLKDNE